MIKPDAEVPTIGAEATIATIQYLLSAFWTDSPKADWRLPAQLLSFALDEHNVGFPATTSRKPYCLRSLALECDYPHAPRESLCC